MSKGAQIKMKSPIDRPTTNDWQLVGGRKKSSPMFVSSIDNEDFGTQPHRQHFFLFLSFYISLPKTLSKQNDVVLTMLYIHHFWNLRPLANSLTFLIHSLSLVVSIVAYDHDSSPSALFVETSAVDTSLGPLQLSSPLWVWSTSSSLSLGVKCTPLTYDG